MSSYELLNSMQKEAVFCTEGPLLILAGAGSGKTRVLTYRIAHLIEDLGVNPWNIMAITFTNKAAGEMKERVNQQVEFGSDGVWVSTFHSSCVRILRRHITFLGYDTNFSIYDADDQKTLIKQIIKGRQLDSKLFKERAVLSQISSAKNELIRPEEYLRDHADDYFDRKVGEIYIEYQERLKQSNALDFDDLIMKTVELFQSQPEVLKFYQERFRYIMVDEYQDTNTAQFRLIDLLAAKYKNLCVVGDDDQSIYKFRGANIGNILNFEKSFPGARVIKLEQNYRSTKNILNAANGVICNNQGRKEKTLWTANEEGDLLRFRQFDQSYEEADFIIKDILKNGYSYEDCAVLYRTNAQSRLLEEKCIAYNIPYRLVGGINFYQRKEIKDVLAYLKTIANGKDDLAVSRIINVPKRGIGAVSLGKVTVFASEQGYSLYDAMARVRVIPGLGKASEKIAAFTDFIEDMRSRMKEEGYTIKQLLEDILEESGYRSELEAEGEVEGQSRLDNVDELVNKAVSYWEQAEEPSLDEFLEEVALVADVDQLEPNEARVTLMTLHSAKGLEFENVYMSGMEDGLFPSYMTIVSDDPTDIEEERRLCYVGITRAKKRLTLTSARTRMVNGETRYCRVSRFLEEIPGELLDTGRSGAKYLAAGEKKSAENHQASSRLSRVQPQKPAGVSRFGRGENVYASKTASFLSANQTSLRDGAGSRNPGFGKTFSVEKKALDYGIGDFVSHGKFGCGTVKEIKDGGRDYEVTVDFETAGTKRMFASFAKLKKL